VKALAIGTLLSAIALGGCANHPLDCAVGFTHADCLPGTAGYQDADKFGDADDKQCKSYGLQPGSGAYSDCRIKLSAQHKSTWNRLR